MGSLNIDGSKISQDSVISRRLDSRDVGISDIQKDLRKRKVNDEIFNILNVPNLTSWWDASDDDTTIIGEFGTLASWIDKGPNSNDLTIVNTAEPWSSPIKIESGLNGKASLLFGHSGGINGKLIRQSYTGFPGAPMSLFVVSHLLSFFEDEAGGNSNVLGCWEWSKNISFS